MNEMNFRNLLPPEDSTHWEPLISRIMDRTVNESENVVSIGTQILRWALPSIAAATVATAIVWGIVLFHSRNTTPNHLFLSESTAPDDRLITWAVSDDNPTTEQLYSLLGGINEASRQ